MELTEKHYQAIDTYDKDYDGIFWYGVTSTHIFCRPSCKSKTPKRENIRIFDNTREAIKEGFRPCKRCKPLGTLVPDEVWVETIKAYIKQNYQRKISLEELADVCHGSVFHLLRVFKKVTNETPLMYQTRLKMDEAKRLLKGSKESIQMISKRLGVENDAQFIALFKKNTGMTPGNYRKEHHDEIYKNTR